MRRFARTIALTLVLAMPGLPLMAQGLTASVTVTGHVRGRAGAPVAGASVSVRALRGHAELHTTSSNDGRYSILVTDTASVTGYDVYVRATGWIPDVVTCRRAPTVGRVNCDVVLSPTRPVFTSAPNEPRPVVVDRARLGNADALEVTIPRGRIFVAGSWDDSVHVSYQLRRDVAGPSRDSILVLPPYDGKLEQSFGPNGMMLRVNAGDLLGNDGVDVRITVPKTLRLLKLTMLQLGEIAVEDFAGELSIRSEGGAVNLANLDGPTLVEARKGNITATVSTTIAHQPMSLLTRAGDIQLMLNNGWGADLDIETRNGIIWAWPAIDGSATPLPPGVSTLERRGPHRASGRFGVAGPLFRIVTLNGDVTVRQWAGPGQMPRWIGRP